METKTYLVTVLHKDSTSSKSNIVTLSEKEHNLLVEFKRNYKYSLSLSTLPSVEIPTLKYQELISWLESIELYKCDYTLSSVTTKVIHLPKGVKFNPYGYLEIYLGKSFDVFTHDDVVRENELASWVIKTFPTSQYIGNRAKFTLPIKREEFANKSQTTKFVFSVSASGNEAVEITKRTYKKVNILL